MPSRAVECELYVIPPPGSGPTARGADTLRQCEVLSQNTKGVRMKTGTNSISRAGYSTSEAMPSPHHSHSSYLSDTNQFAGIISGDATAAISQLPSDTFNVAVTSPPYYWIRDYGYDGQIGHEDSVEEYINALMVVFDEVQRVLHPEGVFFLNIGDTYYSGNGQPHGVIRSAHPVTSFAESYAQLTSVDGMFPRNP